MSAQENIRLTVREVFRILADDTDQRMLDEYVSYNPMDDIVVPISDRRQLRIPLVEVIFHPLAPRYLNHAQTPPTEKE